MTSRTRVWVLVISVPIIIFALVGGYLGQVMAKDDTYQHLRVFDDVVAHVVNNYVEEVDIKQAMRGAMRGLADALDADSAYLTPDLVKAYEGNSNPGPADIGVELTRQYYLRVVSARDGSPAAKAGLQRVISSERSTSAPPATCPCMKACASFAAPPDQRWRCWSFAGTRPIHTSSPSSATARPVPT